MINNYFKTFIAIHIRLKKEHTDNMTHVMILALKTFVLEHVYRQQTKYD